MTKKELAWEAWKEAANTNSSMSDLSKLEERTQRQLFNKWWQRNHE